MLCRSTNRRVVTALLVSSLLGFGLTRSAHGQTPPASQPTTDLPAGDELVAGVIKKMGGKAALARVKSFSCHVKSNMFDQSPDPDEQVASVTLAGILPAKFKMSAKMTTGATAEFITDGKYAWSREPGSDDFNLENIEEVSMFITMMAPQTVTLTLHNAYPSAETIEETSLNGKDAYRVRITSRDKEHTVDLLVDQQSGELVGVEQLIESVGMTIAHVIEEWKEIDGVKLISKSSFDMMGMAMDFSFSDFKLNGVPKSEFTIPDAVKKMIDDNDDDGVGDDDDDGGDD